ncbi:MAG: sulfatase-like hydrolase/transferase [Verrucomicrobiales bacterium]
MDGMPVEGGFDRSYYLADQGRFFSPQRHFEDDAKLPAVERGSGFYGTEAIAGHAVRCLQDHAAHHAGAPFFHFVAFTAPHFPLHAEPGDIAKYAGKYEAGWEALRAARWARQQESGIGGNALSAPERDLGPPYHFPDALEKLGAGEVNRPLPWGDLTAGQQRFQTQKMAIHAAMIDRMDREIGRIIAQLREMGALENTLIVFLSDNGASAEIMVRDDGHDPAAPPGSADTYLCLGPGWSTCANTPFRRHKTWNHEGGIATPFIAHWPAGIKARGELRAFPAHVIDLVPTALALAGAARAHSDAPAAPGTSLLPAFSDDLPPREAPLWWSHEGNAALRLGDWKITRAKGDPWALYDLGKDRAEQRDLSHANPDRAEAMAAQWAAMEAEFVRLAKGE